MAVLACPCPSLKGWYCARKGESRGYCPVMCARACLCCCALCAAVIRAERRGGLCESWMWIMSASAPHPSFQRAALGSWCLLRACLRVRHSKTHGLGKSQMRLVAFSVVPLLRRSCGESQSWSFRRPRWRPRVAIRARCCAVVLFSDALVAKPGASLVCSGASSLWVTVFPSLCSSQGACARNAATSPHFFAVITKMC